MDKIQSVLATGQENINGIERNTSKTFGEGFNDVLKNSIMAVNDLQRASNEAITDFTIGENQNIHETMIAIEKSSITTGLLLEIRNKVVQAYQEVMRMTF